MIQDFPKGFKEGTGLRLVFSPNYDIMNIPNKKTSGPALPGSDPLTAGLMAGERRDPWKNSSPDWG